MLESNAVREGSNEIQDESLILEVKRNVKSFFLQIFEPPLGKSEPSLGLEIDPKISGSSTDNNLNFQSRNKHCSCALASAKNGVILDSLDKGEKNQTKQ